ncbi:thiamine pyrophosphate-dependent enzyme [Mycobacterium sp. C31M]
MAELMHASTPAGPQVVPSRLSPEGRLDGDCPMSPSQVREALERMLESRELDELAIKLQRLGRLGVYGPVHGQEASALGSAMTLDPAIDWIVPASREQPALLHHGLPLDNLLSSYMGRLDHAAIPPGVNLLPRQQAIGAQLPHAAGLAWALKLKNEPGVVMVYCGDGATSEGDFHEALNLAGVQHVPLVVVVINNGYAISTPVASQTAAPTLAARGAGYGMPGVTVDGNDLFAVFDATRTAVDRARAGTGPTLIECRTYRLGFHNTSDNPKAYRCDREVEDALQLEPIGRVVRYCLRAGLVAEQELTELKETVRKRVVDAVHRVTALPRPGPAAIFDHVYETLSPTLEQQRLEAIRNGEQ